MTKSILILIVLFILGCSDDTNRYRDTSICFSESVSEERQVLFSNALDEWRHKSNPLLGDDQKITATIIDNQDDCDFKVYVVPTTYEHLGRTDPNEHWIKIQDVGNELFYHIALHESGHLIVGPNHSDDNRDVMFGTPGPAFPLHLTPNDIERPLTHSWEHP